MQTIATIGLDIAKPVFQLHGVDGAGQVVGLAASSLTASIRFTTGHCAPVPAVRMVTLTPPRIRPPPPRWLSLPTRP
jgi:hypothetical protein